MKRGANDRLTVLISRARIARRVRQLGRRISRDFRGQPVLLVGVLKGASIFLADLSREIGLDASFDFLAATSYGAGSESSGQVRLVKDLDTSIAGRNVILVEDILDTGITLNYLARILRQRRPKTLRVAVLLDKAERRIQPIRVHYLGFSIPNDFVVGYGLDYAERYRNLKDVCVVQSGVGFSPHVLPSKKKQSQRKGRA
ncbi:MAG TPA: hypoxanthine phosphoribosyltransferase [Candidatus Acidoferrales bacterium]|nr:hypoxanthine phosphoribosyltransferase [Candidatus Acidoferrales bacterium]